MHTRIDNSLAKFYPLTSNPVIVRKPPEDAIAHNVPQVGDVALRPTRPKGHVAERRAAAPRSPRRLPRRRCAYVLLSDVALLSVPAFVSVDSIKLSRSAHHGTAPTVHSDCSDRSRTSLRGRLQRIVMALPLGY
jgi:hypothetical protein